MEVTISRIGNSDGIVIPKAVMKRLSLHRSDILVIDEESSDLVLKKKRRVNEYHGVNTGIFARLAEIEALEDAWGGNVSSEEYLKNLRRNDVEKDIQEGLL